MMKISAGVSVLLGTAALASCNAPAEKEAAGAQATPEVVSPAPANAEEDIRHFLLQEYPDADPIMYALAWNDLDGDGKDEAIVYLGGPYFCGTGGCNLLVLAPAGPMWSKAGDVSVSRTPVAVLDTTSNGWKDLSVAIAGGGGPSGTVILKFDGKAYPGNASVAPKAPADAKGAKVIAEMPELKKLEAQSAD